MDALVDKFLAALQEDRSNGPRVMDSTQEDPGSLSSVLVCGHSLGGALAQVTALLAYQEVLRGVPENLRQLLSSLRCITLAAPQPFAEDPEGDAGAV